MTSTRVVQGFPGLPALPALSAVEGSEAEGSLSKAALLSSVRLAGLTASASTSLVELRRGVAVALRTEADKATASPPKPRAKAEGLHHPQLN